MTRRPFFIVNPTAGAGRGTAAWQVCAAWLRTQHAPVDHVFTSSPGEARRLAQAAAQRWEFVVAVGGDGTASEVADGLLGAAPTIATLGVVPCGTGNDFAETLGIGSVKSALATLARGEPRRLDAIAVQCQVDTGAVERYALLFASVGIAGECLKRTTPLVKRLFGQRLAYQVGLVRALWSYHAPPMRVAVDGAVVQKKLLFAGISNSERAGGGLRLAPGAVIDDGQLNVNLVEALGRWEAFGQIRRLSQGRHTAHPRVRYCLARSLAVDTAEPIEVAADGELIGQTPARFEVRPSALTVLAGGA